MDAPEVPPRERTLRDRYLGFIARHEIAWEVTMAVLAIIYVGVGLAGDEAPPQYETALSLAEASLTVVFVAEFASRFLASHHRAAYVRGHWVDLVALIPVARGLRVFRLIRLLRLIRAFAGLHRAMNNAERLANHKGMASLLIVLAATVVIASAVFYAVEAGANPKITSPGDAFWWGVTTIAGGATDIPAVTDEGRIATVVLLVLGVALLAGLTATVVSFVISSGEQQHAPETQLRALARLHDAGIITDAEFHEFLTRMSARL